MKKSATKGIYATDDGEDLKLDFTTSPVNWAIPRYDGGGRLQTNNPIDSLDAVNKQYFEANAGLLKHDNDFTTNGNEFNPFNINEGQTTGWINYRRAGGSAVIDNISFGNGDGNGTLVNISCANPKLYQHAVTKGYLEAAINGQSFKTINGESITGSGDIAIGGVSSIGGKTGAITLGDGLTIIGQILKCTDIGSIRSEIGDNLILQFMGDGGNSAPYGFYAPTTRSIGSITPTAPTIDTDMDIMAYTNVYLYERTTEIDSSKLIKNVTPLILTRGENGFSGAVLMKAPALNDTDSDVYFIMNVSWADGGTMLAQINGLRLDLRVTNNENGEFVGHIIIPSAKWAEGTITFETESLLASGLDYRELPSIFANQNSVYIFRQEWNTESDFQGIVILRADTIDGSYSPVSQGNASIDIVPYSI